MRSLIVFLAFFALSFSFMVQKSATRHTGLSAEATVRAQNFSQYRNAVNRYAVQNLAFSGTVPVASLALPPTWVPQAGWSNRIDGGVSYVWAALPAGGSYAFLEALGRTSAVGVKNAGRFVSVLYGDMGFVLPAYIPDGSVVSVISIN